VTADLSGRGYQDLLVPTVHGVEVLDGENGSEITVLGPRLGFQSSPLVTDDPNGAVGITIAGYNGNNVGVIQHYEIPGSDGALAVGAGSWPMFHHDPSLSGVSSVLPDSGTGTPTVLTAQAGNAQVSLSWAAPTGTAAATGYNVYEGTAPGHESGTPVNGATPVTGTSYLVTGLSSGQSYYFEVTAINSAGEGAPSNEANATPDGASGAPPPAPPIPTTTAPTTTTTTPTTTTTAPTTTTTTPTTTTTASPPTAKRNRARPVVTELTKKAALSGGKVGLGLGCSGAACRGAIKLWYDNVLAGEAAYSLPVGHKSVFSVQLRSSVAKSLGATKSHELLLTQTVTVTGGSTVRQALRLSS